jgi:hypothetical protein
LQISHVDSFTNRISIFMIESVMKTFGSLPSPIKTECITYIHWGTFTDFCPLQRVDRWFLPHSYWNYLLGPHKDKRPWIMIVNY